MSLPLQLKYVTTASHMYYVEVKLVAYVVELLCFSFCSWDHCYLVVVLLFSYRYSFNFFLADCGTTICSHDST